MFRSVLLLGVGLSAMAILGGTWGCNGRLANSNSTEQGLSAAAEPLPSDAELQARLDKAVDFNRSQRHMDQKVTAAWQVVHGVLVYGRGLEIYHDGKLVPAIEYLLQGGTLTGWNLRPGDHGVVAILEAGSKTGMGHPDQWLGYLSQCGIGLDEPLKVGNTDYTVADILRQAQWDIYPGMEATWTLMAASAYLPLDAKWTAKDGTEWTVPRIVEMESKADVDGAACGGSHRLYGLAAALNLYLEKGGNLEGAWALADQRIKESIAKAKANQQTDGSFSTSFFARPSKSEDISKRLGATGHQFEFLTVALDDEQFAEPWMTRAAVSLLDMLEQTQDVDLEAGGLYHALHGLDLYRLRKFGPRSAAEPEANPPSPPTEASAAAAR